MAYRPINVNIPSVSGYLAAGKNVVDNLQGLSNTLNNVVRQQDANQEEFYQKGVTQIGNDLASIDDENLLAQHQQSVLQNPNLRADTKEQYMKDSDARKVTIRNEAAANYKHANLMEDQANEPFMERLNSHLSSMTGESDITAGTRMINAAYANGEISERGRDESFNKLNLAKDPTRKEEAFISEKKIKNWIEQNKTGDYDGDFERFKEEYKNLDWYKVLDATTANAIDDRAKDTFETTRILKDDAQTKLSNVQADVENKVRMARESRDTMERGKRSAMGINEAYYSDQPVTDLSIADVLASTNESLGSIGWDNPARGMAQIASVQSALPSVNVTGPIALEILGMAHKDQAFGTAENADIKAAAEEWHTKHKSQLELQTQYKEELFDREQQFQAEMAPIIAYPKAYRQELVAKQLQQDRKGKADLQPLRRIDTGSILRGEDIYGDRGRADTLIKDRAKVEAANDIRMAIPEGASTTARGDAYAKAYKTLTNESQRKAFRDSLSSSLHRGLLDEGMLRADKAEAARKAASNNPNNVPFDVSKITTTTPRPDGLSDRHLGIFLAAKVKGMVNNRSSGNARTRFLNALTDEDKALLDAEIARQKGS